MKRADVLVVGAGIVGLASAWRLGLRLPGTTVVVLDKEPGIARHQTGRNSGVIHSGLYYRPGSAKARNCRRGKRMLEAFCRENGVAHEICGKVVVAVGPEEVPRLEAILERGRANGVACERIGVERLRELEPHAAGVAALHVPETGIVDFPGVCAALARGIGEQGGEVVTSARVTGLHEDGDGVVVASTAGECRAGVVVNCAGLWSDRLLQLTGIPRPARIVPFRGEYWELVPSARELCRNLIYPVPDPSFPFLGVHFTRMVHGGVECGPNAVLALAREGYRWSDVRVADLWDALSYPGFWRLAGRHLRSGLGEMARSLSKALFVRALSRLVPAIQAEHLVPARSGVRAQALGPDGALVDDFLIRSHGRIVHLLNAPSPAATSALAIGDEVAEHVAGALGRTLRPPE